MKPYTLKVLDHCIEVGSERGLVRAYKHNDSPSPEQIRDTISACIWDELNEWFNFDEDNYE